MELVAILFAVAIILVTPEEVLATWLGLVGLIAWPLVALFHVLLALPLWVRAVAGALGAGLLVQYAIGIAA